MRLSAPIYQLKRQAKQLSREGLIPFNQALNRIAKQEGFESWSLLASRYAGSGPATRILAALTPGDLVLLGARPGHGKTLMGLELIIESIRDGNHAAFYSLEYNQNEVVERLESLGAKIRANDDTLKFDTSDEICADYIVGKLSEALPGTIVVIDYLQLLDQNRQKPILADQVSALKSYADRSGVIVILISQIDRSYDPATKAVPDMVDVRSPNPLDLTLFTKTIFLNNGEVNLQAVA